ncbi:LysR family transcriptional regulator [Ruegeria sp. R13_0]|uniref:LysR family transcriptional regulator n=1 Tax=Ruegeria sp. R13_0 TaxID=2821099 RepID=UPI001ADBCD8D|nr:LysR family transcriptional regulator [Ruegeria sp. R13_0]MBO9436898.1 LysR family transcriptional regulator [Ruegeria sp. R13_0]
MDYFAALRAFRAVVEEDGFAPAARLMGLATSSLTRQVNALEDSLGTQLLNRSTRSVTLTDAGSAYYDQAILVLDALDDANRSVSEAGGAPRGLLRISMPVVFGSLHVAPAMGLFMRRCPEIELDFRLSDGFVNLVEERIDIAIRIGKLDTSSLIARKLAPNRRLICASPDYLGEHGVPEHPDDLRDHNCLCFAFADGDRTWKMEKDGESLSVKVAGSMVANNSEMLRQTAISGGGLLMMPSWLVGEDVKAGRLKPILSDWTVGHGETNTAIHAVYLPNRKGSKKVTAFVDHLAAHFGSPPYWE